MTTPHEVAIDYITTRQWPVFPCRAKEEMHPETGEFMQPKSPYTSKGFRSATTFPRIVDRWWSDNPDAMIGIPTGEPTGVWVLDIDVSDGKPGEETLADLISKNGPLPETREARTASGGRHLYFRHHEGVRNRGALGLGLDVRGTGGYVIAPGSLLATGAAYEWINDIDPVPAPQWLLDLVVRQPAPEHTTATHHTTYSGDNAAYVNAAVDAELSELASTPHGARNNALNDAAFSLGTLVGAGALSRGDAESALESVALQWPKPSLSKGTIKRGLDAGQLHPRHIPEHQDDDDLERWMPQKLLEKLRNKVAAIEPEQQQTEPEHPGPDLPVTATPFKWIDPRILPRREFVYGTHLIRKYVSVTVSPGGIGKTSLTIAEALAMVTGKPLLGEKPPRKLNVWLFNAEDPRDEMDRRIMAAAMHHKIKPDQLEGLFLDSGREQEIVVARDDKKGVIIQEPIVDAVIDQIVRNKIDVMVIDPFVSTHAVSENDNGAIDRVAKLWGYIADVTNCAIEVVHHVRKSEGRDVTVEDARGAVSLLAAARSARVLNRMTDEQANAAGLSQRERFSYFSVTRGKANLAAMSGDMEWRHLESVALGNGAGLSKPQDHAGVVEEWQWPSKESIAEAVPESAKKLALVKLKNQDYRENPQSPDWAGYVVADAMGLDVEAGRAMTPEKRRVKATLEAWIDTGVLQVVEEEDVKKGRAVKFVRPAK